MSIKWLRLYSRIPWGAFKNDNANLAGVAQLVGHRPVNGRVVGSIPSQGTYLGCGFSPLLRHMREATAT